VLCRTTVGHAKQQVEWVTHFKDRLDTILSPVKSVMFSTRFGAHISFSVRAIEHGPQCRHQRRPML
jgi:hypothetical protein